MGDTVPVIWQDGQATIHLTTMQRGAGSSPPVANVFVEILSIFEPPPTFNTQQLWLRTQRRMVRIVFAGMLGLPAEFPVTGPWAAIKWSEDGNRFIVQVTRANEAIPGLGEPDFYIFRVSRGGDQEARLPVRYVRREQPWLQRAELHLFIYSMHFHRRIERWTHFFPVEGGEDGAVEDKMLTKGVETIDATKPITFGNASSVAYHDIALTADDRFVILVKITPVPFATPDLSLEGFTGVYFLGAWPTPEGDVDTYHFDGELFVRNDTTLTGVAFSSFDQGGGYFLIDVTTPRILWSSDDLVGWHFVSVEDQFEFQEEPTEKLHTYSGATSINFPFVTRSFDIDLVATPDLVITSYFIPFVALLDPGRITIGPTGTAERPGRVFVLVGRGGPGQRAFEGPISPQSWLTGAIVSTGTGSSVTHMVTPPIQGTSTDGIWVEPEFNGSQYFGAVTTRHSSSRRHLLWSRTLSNSSGAPLEQPVRFYLTAYGLDQAAAIRTTQIGLSAIDEVFVIPDLPAHVLNPDETYQPPLRNLPGFVFPPRTGVEEFVKLWGASGAPTPNVLGTAVPTETPTGHVFQWFRRPPREPRLAGEGDMAPLVPVVKPMRELRRAIQVPAVYWEDIPGAKTIKP